MASEHKFNVPINLLGLELRNAKFQVLTAAPASGEAKFYYDSVIQSFRFHNGTEWVNADARLATNIPLSALAVNPLARASHTGTQLASTISDFDAQVRLSRLDQMAVPTAALTLNGQRITNLGTPTGTSDAATKAYVDAASTTGNAATATKLATARNFSLSGVITAATVAFDGTGAVVLATAIADAALSIAKTSGLQVALDGKQASLGYTPVNKAGDTMLGALTLAVDPTNPMDAATKQYVDNTVQAATAGIDPKEAVRVATTANITLSGLQTIDTVALAAGDDVLVKNQSTPSQNGIYVAGSGAWIRRADATNGKLTQGALVLVVDGSAHKSQQWFLQTSDPITIGSTGLVWIQFNAATEYSATNGVQLIGDEFSAKIKAAGGLIADATGIYLDTAVAVRKAGGIIGDGSTKTFTLNHGLNTFDIQVTLRNTANNEIEYAGYTAVTANAVAVTFTGDAPAAGAYRVTVTG